MGSAARSEGLAMDLIVTVIFGVAFAHSTFKSRKAARRNEQG